MPVIGHSDLLDEINQNIEYPGQPMMLAYQIMLAFPSFSEANDQPTGYGYSNALGSQMVSGAGCAVMGAMRMLEKGISENLSGDQLIEAMDDHWVKYLESQNAYLDRIKPGIEKTKPLHEGFKELWQAWKTK